MGRKVKGNRGGKGKRGTHLAPRDAAKEAEELRLEDEWDVELLHDAVRPEEGGGDRPEEAVRRI